MLGIVWLALTALAWVFCSADCDVCEVAHTASTLLEQQKVLTTLSASGRKNGALDFAYAGRAVVSNDPERSAAFVQRYMPCATSRVSGPRLEVHINFPQQVPKSGFTLSFVRRNETDYIGKQAIDAFAYEWDLVQGGTSDLNYTEWLDYHDGIEVARVEYVPNIVNLLLLRDDRVPVWFINRYGESGKILRLLVPETAYSLEFKLPSETNTDYWPIASVGRCRGYKAGNFPEGTYWFKATFASSDPVESALFVNRVLGTEHIDDPYPFPFEEGCIGARWVQLPDPDRDLMLHFVASGSAYPSRSYSIAHFVDESDSLLNENGVFLQNTLDLDVEDHTEIISRLDNNKYKLIYEEDYGCALYAAIPRTGYNIRALRKNTTC